MTETPQEALNRTREEAGETVFCPFCGGLVVLGASDPKGEEWFSMCCGIGAELIENYEFYSALPPELQKIALDADRAQFEETDEEARAAEERARGFVEWHEECLRRRPDLFMTARKPDGY